MHSRYDHYWTYDTRYTDTCRQDLRDRTDYRFDMIRNGNDAGSTHTQTRGTPGWRSAVSLNANPAVSGAGSAILIRNLPAAFEIPRVYQMFSSFGVIVGTQLLANDVNPSGIQQSTRSAIVHVWGPHDGRNAVAFAVSILHVLTCIGLY